MKRTGKLFALLAAIVMALVLVPRLAWGADSGDIEDNTSTDPTRNEGTITISNPRSGETYSVYRLFELASFVDNDPSTGQHASNTEAYSYVIREYTDAQKQAVNPWYDFLTQYGPNGLYNESEAVSDTNYPYAILSSVTNADLISRAYFTIDAASIELNTSLENNATYHVITPNEKFKNTGTTNLDYTENPTQPTGTSDNQDAEGASVGGDLTTGPNAIVQEFAQEALKYAQTIVGSDPQVTAEITLPNNNIYATTQPLGYYLVGTTMGTLASLDTNNRAVNIYEKNDEPAIEKKVLVKGSSIPSSLTKAYLTGEDNWKDNTDADFEDYVLFRTVITTQQGAKNYKIHDVMEAGLQFVSTEPAVDITTNNYGGSVSSYLPKVYLVQGENIYLVPATVDSYTNYTLNTGTTDNCDFEILFSDAGGAGYGNDLVQLATQDTSGTGSANLKDIKDGDKIVVLYWAKVVDGVEDVWGREVPDGEDLLTAVKSTDGNTTLTNQKSYEHDGNGRNDNHTVLTYGNSSYTAWDTAAVTTYGFDIVKTKAENSDEVGASKYPTLAEAHFRLYKASTDNSKLISGGETYTPSGTGLTTFYQSSKALSFTAGSSNYYSYDGDTSTSSASTVTDLVSVDGKAIELTGLEAGNYLLVETKAPNGYNKLAHPIIVSITGDTDNDGDGNPTTPEDNEGTITYVFSPNSGADAITTSNHDWNAIITDADGTTPAYYSQTGNGGVHIVNQTGTELPSTGGLGTKAFYAIGGSLFAASVIFLLTKKRLMQAA